MSDFADLDLDLSGPPAVSPRLHRHEFADGAIEHLHDFDDPQHTHEGGKWDDLTSWLKNPQVQELSTQLNKVTEQMAEYEAMMQPLIQALAVAEKQREDFLASIKQTLQQHDAEVNKAKMAQESIAKQMQELVDAKRRIGSHLTDTIEGLKANQAVAEAQAKWDMILQDHEWFWKAYIREYQWLGTRFMAGAPSEGLLGRANFDQMGLGKTLQAGAALDILDAEHGEELAIEGTDGRPMLWVCPNAIKSATWLELNHWSPERKCVVLKGGPGEREMLVDMAWEMGMTLICNYEALNSTPAIYARDYEVKREYVGSGKYENVVYVNQYRDWSAVVLDEAHRFKNPNSKTFGLVEQIALHTKALYPMTGTPILNKPQEFWSILHMMTMSGKHKDRFKHLDYFISDYCTSWGNEVRFAPGAADQLMRQVSDLCIRRRKDEVALELPDKIRQVHMVELDEEQRELYDQMREKFIIWLDSEKSGAVTGDNFLAQLTRLRQLALYPPAVKGDVIDEEGQLHKKALECEQAAKLDMALDIIEELMDNGEKALIFSSYNEPLLALERRIKERGWKYPPLADSQSQLDVECGRIMGGVKEDVRATYALRFNDPDDNLRVMLGNINAMGIGLNLQGACSNAIFLDLWWNPGINEQAEDRLHRSGQKSTVNIHIIQAEKTVDAFIAKKIEDKLNMIEGVIERDELRQALEDGLI